MHLTWYYHLNEPRIILNSDKVKNTDRAVYDSASGGDIYHGSASANAMWEIEKTWLENKIANISNNHNSLLGLEIGCGGGGNLPWIERQCNFVIGLDHSIKAIENAKSKIGDDACLAIMIADAEMIPLKDNSVDLVFCGSILHHLPDYEKSISMLFNCLHENGAVVASEPCAYNPFAIIRRKFFPSIFHTPDERPFPPNEIIEVFRHNFDLVHYKRQFLFSINSSIIEQFLGKKSGAIYLKIAMVFDSILLKIPVIKELCWRIDIIGVKLPKSNIRKK
jgi:SAM-dependent methyltransferase